MSTKTFPKELTSYDFLKALALILMIVDHIGHFFLPDEVWLRVIGRLSVPIWFYLIGYAKSRDVPKIWWLGGLIVTSSSILAGEYLLPVSILFTLALSRLFIDEVMVRALRGVRAFFGVWFLLVLLSFPTMPAVEYGTSGLLFAMLGYLQRHREELKLRRFILAVFVLVNILAFTGLQYFLMPVMDYTQILFLFGAMLALSGVFLVFRESTCPHWTECLPGLGALIRLFGRRTLEIYVLHLLVFRAVAMVIDPQRFEFMEFEFVPPRLIWLFTLH